MSAFVQLPDDPDYIAAWTADRVTIGVRAYAFGQYRIQVWIDHPFSIYGPEL